VKWGHASIALCLSGLLASCGSLPTKQQAVDSFESEQKAAAYAAQDQQRWAQALMLWRTVATLNPQDSEVQTAITTLEKAIQQRSRQGLSRGQAAYARGQLREGDLWMLRVLAVEPGQEQALAALRKSTSERALAVASTKATQENQLREDNAEENSAEDLEYRLRSLYAAAEYAEMLALTANLGANAPASITTLQRSAHVAQADRAGKAGNRDVELEQVMAAMSVHPMAPDPLLDRSVRLRKSLSSDWYRRGTGMMKGDLSGAIDALEKSLVYNPENSAARLKLKQATVLQRNLEKIQGR
jgi:hypothetical protein